MSLKMLIVLFFFSINLSAAIEGPLSKNNLKKYFVDSFNQFKNKILNFFIAPFKKMEELRKKIKNQINIYQYFNGKIKATTCAEQYSEVKESEPKMTAIQLIAYHGYRAEPHIIVTTDGYMLTIHRILPAMDNQTKVIKKRLALLHHGLLGSSEDWLLLGPSKALPYLLSDADYDVWLTNARGNKYSRSHVKVIDKHKFWDFSWHEIGLYDLSAVVDYITEFTGGKSEIHFIGHSLGGTALLVLLSTYPRYNLVLTSATLLSPLVFMYHVKGPFKLLADLDSRYDSLKFLGDGEFLPTEVFSHQIVDKFCKTDNRLCLNPLLFLANGGQEIVNEYIMENVDSHVPAGGSAKTVVHYIQLIKSGQFQMFDYGSVNNFKQYGQKSTPSYSLKEVTLPIVLFSSFDDWLSTNQDMLTLLPYLHNLVIHQVIRKNEFSHTDFVWGEDAPELVFYQMLDILDQTGKKNSH